MNKDFIGNYLQVVLRREPTREEISIAEAIWNNCEFKAHTDFYRQLYEEFGYPDGLN